MGLRDLRALALAALCAGCGDVAVLQGVAEPEANRALAALDRAGVAAEKDRDEPGAGEGATFRVGVARADAARAVAVLAAHALPRREEPGFAETYGARSLVQSGAEERARAAQAVAGELARSLEAIDGVLDARVHVAVPEAADVALDGAGAPRPTASVLVRYAAARPPYDDAAVRRLVAGAVAGMRPEDVTVVGVARAPDPTLAAPRLARVGPIAVAPGSAGTLRGALAVLLTTNLLLAAALIWRVWGARRGP